MDTLLGAIFESNKYLCVKKFWSRISFTQIKRWIGSLIKKNIMFNNAYFEKDRNKILDK